MTTTHDDQLETVTKIVQKAELSQDEIYKFLRGKVERRGPVPGYADYRTPIRKLYLCGAATHPGGGVMGACGYNAAREIIRDMGGKRRRDAQSPLHSE